MSGDVQAQIDEFARDLEALTAQFEALERAAGQTTTAAPLTTPSATVPVWLRPLDDLFGSGAHDEAFRMAEWNLSGRFDSYTKEQLTELAAYLRRVDTPEQKRRDDLISLIAEGLSSTQAPAPAAVRTPYPAREPRPAPRAPKPPRPKLELDLLGPRALAISGGIVTLLGIVFFFVLAVKSGWIDDTARVSLGAIAAAIVFAVGLELKRRFGTTYSTLAAVGAGIAGGYATLLSAASLYHMLSDWEALLAAAAIAAVGLATSVVWRSEIVAGIGLLGALLIPGVIESQGGVSVLATAFAAVVFAVLAAVCVRLGWRILLVAGGIATLVELLVLAFAPRFAHQSPAGVLAVVAIFFVLYATTGIARQLSRGKPALDAIASAFLLTGGLAAAGSFARLLGTSDQKGVALVALAVAYAIPGALFFRRSWTRDLSTLLTFATFSLTAVGLALLLHGDALAYAWVAEEAGLAWLARRVRDVRFQVWSGVYLVLALVHALVDAPPRQLADMSVHPAAGVGTIVAVAAAAAVFFFYARPWSEEELGSGERLFAGFFTRFAGGAARFRVASASLTLVLSVYALSLAVLAVFSSFAWGTVANAVLWMAVGLSLIAAGFRRDLPGLRIGGLIWLGLTGLAGAAQALHVLDGTPRVVAFAAVGVAGVATSLSYGLSRKAAGAEANAVSAATVLLSLALLAYPIAYSLDARAEGAGLLGLAALYAILSAALFAKGARDTSTLYWTISLGVAAVADVLLLHGTYMVLGWAAAGVAVAWIGERFREPRLHIGAAALTALAVGRAFALQAPPDHLFATRLHPAYGTASIFIAALAVAGVAFFARADLARLKQFRTAPRWIAGGLAVYGLSLLILELVERISRAGLHTEFQRGQTAVSAFWGLLGLALLYLGLKQRRRMLRIAGLAFFPISLAKIFLFDLPSLSSVTRALSFLAVGAVLLLGGFFYQRLVPAAGDRRGGARKEGRPAGT